MARIRLQWDQIDERFRMEEEECKRKYETAIETMSRQQKREMEKLELHQNNELKQDLKRLKVHFVVVCLLCKAVTSISSYRIFSSDSLAMV